MEQFAAHLRFHFKITPRQWKEANYTEEEILEWMVEFYFIKEELGEVKKIQNKI